MADLEAQGFFACSLDLEDELIRAAGPSVVEAVLAARGDLERFRTFQRQPAQRDRRSGRQLHRFAGTAADARRGSPRTSSRCSRSIYVPRGMARLLAEAVAA